MSNSSVAVVTPNPCHTTPPLITTINYYAYTHITPAIVLVGIVGDVLTIYILSQPILRKASVIYMYLTHLAITDLLTLVSVLPMTFYLSNFKLCTYAAYFYYSHIGFPLTNALMGISVWIVVFLTFNQYIAICYPFRATMMTKTMCVYLTLFSILLNVILQIPAGWKYRVAHKANFTYDLNSTVFMCEYSNEDNRELQGITAQVFRVYGFCREVIARILPCIALAYFNIHIIYASRKTQKDRMTRISNKQRDELAEKTEKDQKRLSVILLTIVVIFFICTVPASWFTIFVSEAAKCDVSIQIARTVTNLMEFTKYALNFYLYCMINPDIRKLCVHKLRCRKFERVPMEASRTDIRSIVRLMQAAETLSMRNGSGNSVANTSTSRRASGVHLWPDSTVHSRSDAEGRRVSSASTYINRSNRSSPSSPTLFGGFAASLALSNPSGKQAKSAVNLTQVDVLNTEDVPEPHLLSPPSLPRMPVITIPISPAPTNVSLPSTTTTPTDSPPVSIKFMNMNRVHKTVLAVQKRIAIRKTSAPTTKAPAKSRSISMDSSRSMMIPSIMVSECKSTTPPQKYELEFTDSWPMVRSPQGSIKKNGKRLHRQVEVKDSDDGFMPLRLHKVSEASMTNSIASFYMTESEHITPDMTVVSAHEDWL